MPESSPRANTGRIALGAWLVACLLAFAGLGGFLAESIEGVDTAMIPKLLPALAVVAVIVALVTTVQWARRLGGPAGGDEAAAGLGRRRFLAGSAAVAGGAIAVGASVLGRLFGWMTVTGANITVSAVQTDPNPRAEWKGARIQRYRRLGRTDVEVSDIAMGTTQLFRNADPVSVMRAALDRGVSYIDTSPDYAGSKAERAIGEAIRGRRQDLFLATKWCTTDDHVRQGASVATYIESVEGSLQRLGTDHVDLVHVHSCDSVERLLDPNLHEAFDRLRQQGKVRFMGVSTHTPNLEEVANAALESDRFDVMMLAYHHGAWPQLADIVDRAHAQDVGIVAMKTLKGARHQGLAELRPEADAYSQAAFKWVLANPSVSCLVVSFFEHQHVDEYLYASGAELTPADTAVLEKYDRLIAGKHCFEHGGAFLDACPE
jgi:aryl-alcohol dehydrogenase-like predicted oxidoreductase